MANNGRVVIEIEGNWKKLFKQAQGVVDNLGESISDELYQSMEQAFSRLSKIDIDAKLVSVFNRFQNAISKTKDPLKIQDAIRQFDESAKFFESIEKMASSNGINNVFLGIDKDGLKDFMSLADKVIAKQQELLKYNNRTKEYSRNYDEMIGENGKYTLKSLDDVIKFTGHKSSDEKKYIAHVGQFFKEKVVGKTDKYQDTINEFGKLVGLLFELENQKFEADDIRSVQKEMGLDIIRGQIRNLFNNSNDATKKLINQYAKDNKVKLGIKDKPYDLQKDYGNFAKATTDRINSDINDITQQAYTLILNEAQKVSESFQDRDKQIGTVLEGFAKEVAEAFNQLDETFKKKYSTKDISEIKDKLKAAYEKFANNYKGGKLTDDTFNDLKEVIGYYQRFLTLGGTESDMLGFDWFDKNHRTLVTGTSKHLTSTSYGKEINELSKNIQLLSQVIDQIGTGTGGSGAGIGGGSGDGSGNGSGSGDGSGNGNGNGNLESGIDKSILDEFASKIIGKLEELKVVIDSIKTDTKDISNIEKNTEGFNTFVDLINNTTSDVALIKKNSEEIGNIKQLLGQEIYSMVQHLSNSISGFNFISIENHLSTISGLLSKLTGINPTIEMSQMQNIKGIFGDVVDIIFDQIKTDKLMKQSGAAELNERALFWGDNYVSTPFFHGDNDGNYGMILLRDILKDGHSVKYGYHSHADYDYAQMSFPMKETNSITGKIETLLGDIGVSFEQLSYGVEEQIIGGLNDIQVFFSKDFFDKYAGIIADKNFAEKYIQAENEVYELDQTTNLGKQLILKALSQMELFTNNEMIEKHFGLLMDGSEITNSIDIFKKNINKYIEYILNNLTEGQYIGDEYNKLNKEMVKDGIDKSSAQKIIEYLKSTTNMQDNYDQALYAQVVDYVLDNTFGIKDYLKNYTKHYNLNKDEDVAAFKAKYGQGALNAIIGSGNNKNNVGLGISHDFDADEFINQITSELAGKYVLIKAHPDMDPDEFISQIITALSEKTVPIKVDLDEESLNGLKTLISNKLSEDENLKDLGNILDEVIRKIKEKNELFQSERNIVNDVVSDEIERLTELANKVKGITDTATSATTTLPSQDDNIEDDQEQEKKEERSLNTLKEKIDYLKEMKTLYEFLYGKVSETSDTGRTKGAEDKLHDWTEWGYDTGGDDKHKPKSNEQSIKRINDYEELEEKIKETKSVLEDFDMTYEEIIVTMKDGSKIVLTCCDDFDDLKLNVRSIQDIQFKKDFSEEIENVYDLLGDIDAYNKNNVNKQLFPPTVQFLETEDDINNAITDLKSYKKELEDVLNGEVFNQLKSGIQDDVRSSLNYINTLIKSTETQLDIYRKIHQEVNDETGNGYTSSISNINVDPLIDHQAFADSVTKQLEGVSATINVKPNLDPHEFAQEVTDLLKETNAQIGVEPSPDLNAKEFTDKVTTLLSGHTVGVDVELNNSRSQEAINEESAKLDTLGDSLDEITRKVNGKTMAFVNEKGEVEKVVNIEKSKLNELKESVESVSNSVNDLAQGLKEVSDYANNTIKLEVKNKDGNTSTSPSAGSSTDGLNGDTILNEQFFNIDDLKEKNKGVAELEKRLGGVLDVVKQIRKGKDGDYVSFRLTGEKGSAWVGANGDVLRLTTKEKGELSDKRKQEKEDRKIWDQKYHAAQKDNYIRTHKAERKIWDVDYEKAIKENYIRDYKKQREIWDKAYSEAQKENYKFDKINETKNRKIWDVDYENAIKENYLRDLKSNRKIWDDAYNAAYKENRKRDRKIWDKDYNNAYKENYKRDQDIKKEQEKQDAQRQKRLNKMNMDQAKGDAKRRISAIENTLKLSDSENKYFTDSYYKNLFESQVGQSATATFKDQKDATHWQGVLVDNEMQAIIDAQSKLIDAEKEFDKVKKNFDNDSVTYADRYDEVVKKLKDAREEFEKLNADEFYKGNKTGISNDLVDKYEKQNTTLKDTLLARESRNNSSNTEGTSDEKLKKRKKRILELINVFDVYMSKLDSYPEHAEEIKQTHANLERFSNGPIDTVADDDLDKIERLGKQLRNVDKLAKENRIEKLIGSITEFMRRNSKMSRESADEFKNLINMLKGGNLLESEINDISTSFEKLKTKIRESGEAGRSFLDVFKQKIVYVTAQQLAMYFSFNDIIRYARTAAQSVINLNTQFTELAKVSDTSIKQLESDFSSYANTAKEVGGTISDTISATADWARMGYNLPDSKELSRVALIYKNVGDGIDINTANESLISTLKGFQMEASDAMEIIDKFNEVSNNFAISSSGIGEALQRSAASFYAANTDLSKSVALVTTANTVLQDPQVVGNMWKTMSARIRGAKTELEDLGEEEDEFTESTSKLRNLVMGLTGFDIMEDKDTFKDIYDIMIGIGKKWQDLTDIERASLGEALAGKRMANGLYAVLNNIDDLEKAYATAEGSAGSAMREQERYQQSIQYSIDQTKASLEELASTVISSDLLKYLVDVANAFTNIATQVTKLGGLTSLIGGGIGFAAGFTNKSLDIFGLGTKRKNKKQIKLGKQGLAQYTHDMQNITDPNAINAIWNNAFKNTTGSVRELAEQLKEGTITADQFETSLNELGNKAKTSTSLFSGFKNILKGIGKGLLVGAISFGIEKLISGIYALATVDKKITELAHETADSIQKTNKSVSDYKDKLEELNKTIHSSSSTEEQIYNARKEMIDLQNNLVDTFGKEAEGINLVTMSYEKQLKTLNELQRKKNEEDLRKFNSEGGKANNFSNWIHGYDGNLERLESEYFNDETITLKMSYEVGDVSDEYIKKLKDAGVEFKKAISDTNDYDPTDIVTYGYEAVQTLDQYTSDLKENESVQLSDLIQFSGTAKEIYEQAVAIKRITGQDDSFERLNNELDDIIDKYGKLVDEYEDIAQQHILNDYIFSENPDNIYDDYFYDIMEFEDRYQDALLSGDQKKIDAVLKEYSEFQEKIDGTDLEMFDEEKEKQIHDFFVNMYPEIQSAVDEWDIRVKIKNVDISAFGDRTKDELEKLLSLKDFRDRVDKYVKDYQELIDSGKLKFSEESRDDYIRHRFKLDKIDIENSGNLAKDLGLTAKEYELMMEAITDGTYDALDAILAETDDISKALEVLGIKSKQVIEDESKLSKSMVDSAKSAKDQIESLSQTLEKLRAGNLKSGDLIAFLSDDANSEFIKSADNLESAIVERMKSIRQGTIDSVKDLPDDLRQYWTDVVNKAFDYDEATSKINEVNASLDKLQDGMKTLSSAFEEYNENGFITLDTLQSLMTENGEYIQMLTIENGQLKINEEAYKAQMAVKLNDFKLMLDKAAAAEINALAESKTTEKIESNVDALNAETIAYGENTTAAINNALNKNVTNEEINEIIKKYDAIYGAAVKGYKDNFNEFSGATSSAAKDASDTAKEELDNYIALQDALLDAGKISFQDYCTNVKSKLDDMYNSGKLSAKDYFDSVKTFLEKQQSIYDKVLSAVEKRFDKEIEGIDEQINAINKENEALDKQKEEYDKILSVVQEVYDNEIKSLNDQKDAIQEKIDALQDANDEEDRALALANARYALEKAQQQRTRLVYSGEQGFVYKQDEEAIRSAKKELKQAELDNTISLLEKEQEALDKDIEKLEEYKEKWSEVSETYDKEVNRQLAIQMFGENYEQIILQSREQDIQNFTDNYVELQKKQNDNSELIKSLEEKKEYYEELKKQWQEITSIYEESIDRQHTASVLGADWEQSILKGRTDVLEKFKNDYISIQEQIKQAAIDSAKAQADADKGGSGSGGGGGYNFDTSGSNNTKGTYHVQDKYGNIYGGEFFSEDDAKAYMKSSEFATLAYKVANKYKEDPGFIIKLDEFNHGFRIYDSDKKDALKGDYNSVDEAKAAIEKDKELLEKYKKGKLSIQAFSKGGVISAKSNKSPLTELANRFGEDTPVLAKHGERILTPVQNKYWEKWTNALPNLTKNIDALKFNLPNFGSILGAIANKETTVKQEISISLPNVTNNSGAEYVINALKTLPLEAVQRVNRR